tara:strand:+ start:195 stop:929 length:735 start_codon:yes stop_codon:yes gene_type:complete
MKRIKIKLSESNSVLPCGHAIEEGCGCDSEVSAPNMGHSMPNTHNQEEARMHRTTLAHLMADTKVLLDMIQDEDDLPEWLETKITKAGDYMSSAARYIAGTVARDQGQLEEGVLNEICEVDDYFNLYESLQDAVDENGNIPCPQCLYETIVDADCGCPDVLEEAKYKGKKVQLNKPKRGGSKKFYVYVKGCAKDKSRVTKVSFGDPNMKIKKSNPKRRKSFRARHKCATAKDKCTARYWSCKKW